MKLALTPGTSAESLRESLDQPFGVEITRSGVGVAGVLEVPVGLLEVVEANAISEGASPARVRVMRDGDLDESLVIGLKLGGSAKEGVHIAEVPEQVTIPAGQAFAEIHINASAAGLADGPKIAVLQLSSGESFQLGNPHEAILDVGANADAVNGTGFDRWLQASTEGAIGNLADLARIAPARVGDYLCA